MRKIQVRDKDQLAYEEPLGLGGMYYGALALLGAALPATWLTSGGFGDGRGLRWESGWEAAVFLGLAGAWLLFILSAFQKAFRRVAFVMDRRQNTVRTRSWWPFPPGRSRSLESCRFVAVIEVTLSGPLASSIPRRLTTVSLLDASMARPLRIAIGEDDPMRTLAEDVARFAGLDLLDATGTQAVVTSAADVGRPLRPVASPAREPRVLSPLPPRSTLVVSNPANGLRVEFANGSVRWFCVLVSAVIGILSVMIVTALRAESLRQWLIYPIFGSVAILVLLIFGSTTMPTRTVLEADVDGLRVSRYRVLGKKLLVLRPDSLRGFQPGALVFTIRFDSGQWHTHGLTAAEMSWLAEALSDALAGHVALHNPATV